MPSQQQRLTQLEAVVARGVASFVEAGCALREIREQALYKLTHATWRAYCRERWGWSDEHARRLMLAAEVAENLGQGPQHAASSPPTGGDGPTTGKLNERQARTLVGLPPEQQRDIWQQAMQTREEPTARDLEELIAAAGVPEPPPPAPPTPREALREEVTTQEEESKERSWHDEQLRYLASGEKKIRQAQQWLSRAAGAAEAWAKLAKAAAATQEARAYLQKLAEVQGWLDEAALACEEC